MSTKKSLGSSPIGFSSAGDNSFNFIPDREIKKEVTTREKEVSSREEESPYGNGMTKNGNKGSRNIKDVDTREKSTSNKKIVSYYLEEDLIDRLKSLADDQGMFYSALVSRALEFWIDRHDT